jgi:peptide/nickel transport system ATP-binding protein
VQARGKELDGVLIGALVAGLVPFGLIIKTHSTTVVNGVQTSCTYHLWSGWICGVIGLLCVAYAVGTSRHRGRLFVATSVLAVALSIVQILRGAGLIGGPCNSSGPYIVALLICGAIAVWWLTVILSAPRPSDLPADRVGAGATGAGMGATNAHMRDPDKALLRVEHLVVEFPVGRQATVHAVSDINLDVLEGETLGLVGESGCGKSTTGRAIIQLPRPTSGRVLFQGRDLVRLPSEELRKVRPQMQLIFQDPISSLNPRRKVGDIVREPLEIWNRGAANKRDEMVDEVLDAVGLDPNVARGRRPHEFSGGQCQRICIARALVLEPKVIICDEPVSALDVSVQAQILNLLEDMKHRYGLTLIFIAHDLAVVKNVSDRIAVMYLGKLCEVAPPESLYTQPAHPYTAALLASIPVPDPQATTQVDSSLAGDLPSPLNPPSGCRFRTRCPRAKDRCADEEPQMRPVLGSEDHFVACHFPLIEAAEAPMGPSTTDVAIAGAT